MTVTEFYHIDNDGIACNKKVQLEKFYNKTLFSPFISTFSKAINSGHFATWTNLTTNLTQTFLIKITETSKGHSDQFYQNILLTKNFKPPALPIIKKYTKSETIIKGNVRKK